MTGMADLLVWMAGGLLIGIAMGRAIGVAERRHWRRLALRNLPQPVINLSPPTVAELHNPSPAMIDTSALYTGTERAEARFAYGRDHPTGPPWDEADKATRGRYLEAAAKAWLERLGRGRG